MITGLNILSAHLGRIRPSGPGFFKTASEKKDCLQSYLDHYKIERNTFGGYEK